MKAKKMPQASSASESLNRETMCLLYSHHRVPPEPESECPFSGNTEDKGIKLLGATEKCKETEGTEKQQVKKALKDISKKLQQARVSYRIRGHILGDKARRGETWDHDVISQETGRGCSQTGRKGLCDQSGVCLFIILQATHLIWMVFWILLCIVFQ